MASGNAPERNGETAAIELDSTATTPQVAFHTAPEARYRSCLPEVVDSLGCENKEESAPKSAYNRRLSKIMLFTILALFVAVAIGIGVGVGLTRKKHSISEAQQEEILSYHRSILPGSSLAVIGPPNGTDRRLFFQIRNGNIVQAIFQDDKWNTQFDAGFRGRDHTPISVTFSWDNFGILYLFYIIDGYVAMSIFSIQRAKWEGTSRVSVDGNDTTTNANASSLSATSTLVPGKKAEITLLYENRNGDMIMLRGTPSSSPFLNVIKWRDISPELRSAAPDAILRSPFSSGSIMGGRSEIIMTRPKIPSSNILNEDSAIITYQNGTFTSGKRALWPGTGRFLPNANDDGTFLFTIDQPKELINFNSFNTSRTWNHASLSGQFPFSKAAAFFHDLSGALIVYHQTDNFSIAEEVWDPNIGDWINGTWINYAEQWSPISLSTTTLSY